MDFVMLVLGTLVARVGLDAARSAVESGPGARATIVLTSSFVSLTIGWLVLHVYLFVSWHDMLSWLQGDLAPPAYAVSSTQDLARTLRLKELGFLLSSLCSMLLFTKSLGAVSLINVMNWLSFNFWLYRVYEWTEGLRSNETLVLALLATALSVFIVKFGS